MIDLTSLHYSMFSDDCVGAVCGVLVVCDVSCCVCDVSLCV